MVVSNSKPGSQLFPKVLTLNEGLPATRLPPENWVEMDNGQWLRVVRDVRMYMAKRIFRVELFDRQKQTRLAVFRRANETTPYGKLRR
jgi:hypothetical protein